MSVNSTVASTRSDAGGGPSRAEKPVRLFDQDVVGRRIRPAELVTEAGNLDDLSTRDGLCDVPRLLGTTRSVRDQRRSPHRPEHVAYVPLHFHAKKRSSCSRTGAAPHVADVPVLKCRIVRHRRADRAQPLHEKRPLTPSSRRLAKLPTPVALGLRPRIVLRPHAAGSRVIERQPRRPLRIRGCEQDRQPAPFLRRPQGSFLDVEVVEHGADVVHPRFEIRHFAHAIRETRAALVEHDDARERGEAFDLPDPQRLLPGGQELGQRAADEDEIERPRAEDLVRDRGASAPGIANVGHVHARKSPI